MRRVVVIMLALVIVLPLAACGDGGAATEAPVTTSQPSGTADEPGTASDALDASWNSARASHITLKGGTITVEGRGAVVDGSIVTITSAGTYSISGTLDDGQIRVDTQDQDTVRLVLNGANITCATSAPIYVVNAEKTVLILEDGTENYVADGAAYIFADAESDEPNAAIFSHDDLTINGSGSLTVAANYNNGIQSKDDLKIVSGTITVNAVNDGIKGRDSVAVRGGVITVSAGGDGIQSNNDEDAEEGRVFIEGGTIAITAERDGIQAETGLFVSGGTVTITSGGGSVNGSKSAEMPGDIWGPWGTEADSGSDDTPSAKGLKAGVSIEITGGSLDIDAADDAVHSNDRIEIDGGDIALASGDDGIHADAAIEISGGDIDITKSYEGIEGATITISDGAIHIVSSDDGINVRGENEGSAMMGRPGPNSFIPSGNYYLNVSGGYVVVDATGDGLDINGSIDMTGGSVIINGPTADYNGAVDYMGDFRMTGGFLVAVGSAGMPQAPSVSSTQYSVMVNLPALLSGDAVLRIETEDGEGVLTFMPIKAFRSVVLSSPELESGITYVVYSGGSATGTATDGLFSGGTYTAGTQVESFTISSMVTVVGSTTGAFPGTGGGWLPGARRR